MDIDKFAELIKQGKTTNQKVEDLCGRIIRGKVPKDFETLTDDPDRKIVMLVDPDGLDKMLGKTGYEMLVEVGYEKDYLEHKVKEGNQFKLVVFPDGGAAKLATWDNVIQMVKQAYPGIVFPKVIADNLKRKKFYEIEKEAGYEFLKVEKEGKKNPQFMTYERFADSNQTLADYRAFLYFTIHLRELYSGDGWTYDANGNRGVKEYIIPNLPLADLGEHRVIDINVALP